MTNAEFIQSFVEMSIFFFYKKKGQVQDGRSMKCKGCEWNILKSQTLDLQCLSIGTKTEPLAPVQSIGFTVQNKQG